MMNQVRWLTCIVLALQCFSAVGDDTNVDKKKKSHASAAAECEKAIAAKKSELAKNYSSEVWNLKQRFQQDGDLEKALAADEEWSRSFRRVPLTPEDVVASPEELRELQNGYLRRFDVVAEQAAADFVRKLESEAADLARAGNLADGRVLQQEIDKLKRLYLNDKSTNAKKAAAGNKAPEDPVAACEEAIRQKRVALQAQYVGELEALEKSFQAKGALEDLFASKGERERFLNGGMIDESNFVESPAELLALQSKHLDLQAQVSLTVAEEMLKSLEQMKQRLTIEGNLEQALTVKKDIERLNNRFAGISDIAQERAGIPSYVTTESLAGWWPLDGNANDASKFGSHGKITGAVSVEDRLGRKGKAMRFNGQSAFMEIADKGPLSISDSFSVSVWFSVLNASQPVQCIIGKGTTPPGNGTSLNILVNNGYAVFSCGVNDGRVNTNLSSNDRSLLSGWNQAVFTSDGKQITMYRNGEVASQQSVSLQLQNAGVSLCIGRERAALGRYFCGDVDDVGLWTKPLSAAQVRRMFAESRKRGP